MVVGGFVVVTDEGWMGGRGDVFTFKAVLVLLLVVLDDELWRLELPEEEEEEEELNSFSSSISIVLWVCVEEIVVVVVVEVGVGKVGVIVVVVVGVVGDGDWRGATLLLGAESIKGRRGVIDEETARLGVEGRMSARLGVSRSRELLPV